MVTHIDLCRNSILSTLFGWNVVYYGEAAPLELSDCYWCSFDSTHHPSTLHFTSLHFLLLHHHRPSVESGGVSQVMTGGNAWEAGSPAVEAIVNDPSCYGVLGQTLADALEKFENPCPSTTTNDDDANESMKLSYTGDENDRDDSVSGMQLSSEASSRILKALGQSIATAHANDSSAGDAPSALLRGRVDHYNRRNNKWRMAVKAAQFRKRSDLKRNRRMRERPSLWQVSHDNASPSTSTDPTKLSLELLFFNDIN